MLPEEQQAAIEAFIQQYEELGNLINRIPDIEASEKKDSLSLTEQYEKAVKDYERYVNQDNTYFILEYLKEQMAGAAGVVKDFQKQGQEYNEEYSAVKVQ